jgi:tetraacyldisaccharide 4'-kinase
MNFPPLIRALLWPLSVVYGAVVRLRAWLYAHGWLKQKRLKGAVISVGNLTVGGTGKTPMVIWLAEKFLAEGKRVAILSRGYRGSRGTSDEIELMKHRLPGSVLFGVGSDRFAEGQRLESQGIDIFLLDDGFQHLQLARDADIVLIDGSREFRDEMLLPAGSLREPHSALSRADLIVYTRMNQSPEASGMIEQVRGARNYAFFTSETRLLGFRGSDPAGSLCTRGEIGTGPFFAFCGIGNPDAFFSDLNRWQLPVVGKMAFRDHHHYVRADCDRLQIAATKSSAQCLLTTEKDLQNLSHRQSFSMPVYASVIDIVIRSQEELMSTIRNKLNPRAQAPS